MFHRCFFLANFMLLMLSMFACAGRSSSVPVIAPETEWDLSADAQITFYTLRLDLALRDDDPAAVTDAVDNLARLAPQPQTFLDASLWFLGRKAPINARKIAEQGVTRFPDDLTLRMVLAESLSVEGKTADAVEQMRAFVHAHPTIEEARLELGVMLVKTQQMAEAEKIFAGIPEARQNPFVRYYRARALEGLNRRTEALRELRKALDENPDFPEAQAELAFILEKKGDLRAAREAYTPLLEMDSNNVELWLHVIYLDLRLGAIDDAMQLAQTGPQQYSYFLSALSMFMENGLYTQAGTLLDLLRQSPDAPEDLNFYQALLVYETQHNSAATLELLDKIKPESAFYERGARLALQVLLEGNKPEQALERVRQMRQALPDQKDFARIEIQLLLDTNQLAEALEAVNVAAKTWPDEQDILFTQGIILSESGKTGEALALMEALLLKNPENYQALNFVGYSLADEGKQLDRAIILLQQAVKLAPDLAYIMDSLAWALFKKGDIKAAWTTIRKASTLEGANDPTIWEHYGEIARSVGLPKEARKGYRKALELGSEQSETISNRLDTL